MGNDKLTLTSGLPRGKETQTLLALQQRGVTISDFAAIGEDSLLADAVARTIIDQQLFSSPQDQKDRILEFNERIWHDPAITAKRVHNLRVPMAFTRCDDEHLLALTLLYETGDPAQTLRRNWLAYEYSVMKAIPGSSLQPLLSKIDFHPNAKTQKPGFRWAVVDLRVWGIDPNASYQTSVERIRKLRDYELIGQELPLLAAMHPRWVKALNGRTRPFIVASNLIVQGGSPDEAFVAICSKGVIAAFPAKEFCKSFEYRIGCFDKGSLQ